MAGRTKASGPTKNDVELARLHARYLLLRLVVLGLTVIACIFVAQFPLAVIRDAIKPLAGKKTEINMTIPLAVTLTLSLGLNGFLGLKGRFRRSEILRERSRGDELEDRLGVRRRRDG